MAPYAVSRAHAEKPGDVARHGQCPMMWILSRLKTTVTRAWSPGIRSAQVLPGERLPGGMGGVGHGHGACSRAVGELGDGRDQCAADDGDPALIKWVSPPPASLRTAAPGRGPVGVDQRVRPVM